MMEIISNIFDIAIAILIIFAIVYITYTEIKQHKEIKGQEYNLRRNPKLIDDAFNYTGNNINFGWFKDDKEKISKFIVYFSFKGVLMIDEDASTVNINCNYNKLLNPIDAQYVTVFLSEIPNNILNGYYIINIGDITSKFHLSNIFENKEYRWVETEEKIQENNEYKGILQLFHTRISTEQRNKRDFESTLDRLLNTKNFVDLTYVLFGGVRLMNGHSTSYQMAKNSNKPGFIALMKLDDRIEASNYVSEPVTPYSPDL